jgi:hypothetical protein
MTLELIEAIKNYYNDDPLLQADILQDILHNRYNTKLIRTTLQGICRDNDICPICLSKLSTRQYKELRPYQEGNVDERMSELVCENCGKEVD